MGRRSVDKGKAREREVLGIVRRYFREAYRSGHAQGEGGKHKKPDVEGLPGVWLSVKGGAAPRVLDAVDEASEAAGVGLPVVAFRRDGRAAWWAALPLPVLVMLLAEGRSPTARSHLKAMLGGLR